MRRAAALLLVCSACDGPGAPATSPATLPGVVAVSGNAPWNSSCRGPPGRSGVLFPNAEAEPQVAIDPTDPKHLIGIWQQDRWSNGGANGLVSAVTFDGGHTWTQSFAKLTRCSGGAFQRASDPWVSISPNGIAYQIGFAFDWDAPNRAMLVSRSTDGGRTWETPIPLQQDADPDLAMDKETLTADPLDSHYAYAVWDRLTRFTTPGPQSTGPTWFSRTSDGGTTWDQPARSIYDPGPDAQTISNQIVVLPDGTLVNTMMVITQNSTPNARSAIAVLRSSDHGTTWPGPPVTVAEADFVGVADPKSNRGIRSGNVVHSIAVDRSSSSLYVVWADARFSSMQRDGIVISASADGGLSWSPPRPVNPLNGAPAFTPTVAVADGGKVGVSYYDLRNDNPSDPAHLLATHWLATSTDGGATFSETMIGGPFDLHAAPVVEGPAWFLGDYQGLATAGSVFLPMFVAAPGGGPTNVFFRPADLATATSGTLRVAARGFQQMWLGARERWRFGTLFK